MSDMEVVTITCPHCGKAHEFQLFKSVNVTLNPELKEKLLSRELFTFRCPSCGGTKLVFHACLYHDMQRHIMIQLCAPEDTDTLKEVLENGPKIFESFMPSDKQETNYTYRIVNDFNDLNEKILIFEHNRDDHVIELMKVSILGKLKDEGKIQHLYYAEDEGEEIILVVGEDRIIGEVVIPEDMYENVKELYEENKESDEETMLINRDWAVDFIFHTMGEEGKPKS